MRFSRPLVAATCLVCKLFLFIFPVKKTYHNESVAGFVFNDNINH